MGLHSPSCLTIIKECNCCLYQVDISLKLVMCSLCCVMHCLYFLLHIYVQERLEFMRTRMHLRKSRTVPFSNRASYVS